MTIPGMPPDIVQQIGVFIRNILIHNGFAVVYTIGAGIWFLSALYRPTRTKLITLVGFLFLLFAFEYNKHIVQPLLAQTQQTLQTQITHARFDWLVRITLTRIAPLAFYAIGIICVISGMIVSKGSVQKSES